MTWYVKQDMHTYSSGYGNLLQMAEKYGTFPLSSALKDHVSVPGRRPTQALLKVCD
jgi:hypothetical protein